MGRPCNPLQYDGARMASPSRHRSVAGRLLDGRYYGFIEAPKSQGCSRRSPLVRARDHDAERPPYDGPPRPVVRNTRKLNFRCVPITLHEFSSKLPNDAKSEKVTYRSSVPGGRQDSSARRFTARRAGSFWPTQRVASRLHPDRALLVVIAIIAILAALLLRSCDREGKSRRTSCRNGRRQLGLAVQLYGGRQCDDCLRDP